MKVEIVNKLHQDALQTVKRNNEVWDGLTEIVYVPIIMGKNKEGWRKGKLSFESGKYGDIIFENENFSDGKVEYNGTGKMKIKTVNELYRSILEVAEECKEFFYDIEIVSVPIFIERNKEGKIISFHDARLSLIKTFYDELEK